MFSFHLLTTLDKHLDRIQTLLQESVFLVGWGVRDALFGRESDDIDATGSFSPDIVWERLNQKKTNDIVGLFHTEKYWTATILWEESLEKSFDDSEIVDQQINYTRQISYEITPFREEGGYDDLRHPTEIRRSRSLLVDAGRRDFTINALYYTTYWTPKTPTQKAILKIDEDDLASYLQKNGWTYIVGLSLLIVQDKDLIEQLFHEGKYNPDILVNFCATQKVKGIDPMNIRILIDPMLWLQDMYIQKLRTVWDPDKRFGEDALRILRALRFVNVWNQQIPWAKYDFARETRESIKHNHMLIQYVAKERIHQELVKVFSANNPFGYVALLDDAHILQFIFPSLYRTKNNEQPVRYHPFDTYAHTLLTLWHLQQINTDYLVKLGMLYHDVWKPAQYEAYAQATTKEERNAIHASDVNHVVSWPEYVKTDMSVIGFSNKEIEEIRWYVAEHMKPWQILEATKENQVKKMRTLYAEAGYERTKNLLDVCKADRLWQYNPLQWNEITAVDILYAILEKLRVEEWQFTKDQLAISWNDIMTYFGMQPWPEIGELLAKAFDRVLHENDKRNNKELILSYLTTVK